MAKMRMYFYILGTKPYYKEVLSVEEAKTRIDAIADFVNTKVDEGVFPDHCSTAGLEEYDEKEKEWVTWYDEDGLDFDEHFALERVESIIEADKEQENTYNYLLHGAKSLVKDHPDLVRDIWNCKECEHTEDECKNCYPELGYKNDKLKRDSEAVEKFVESDFFEKLMERLDKQDRAVTGERIKYIPMSVIEDIKAEIELQKKGFPPSSDYYKAITRTVNIIDKHISGKEQKNE